jgi:hypothetical protein
MAMNAKSMAWILGMVVAGVGCGNEVSDGPASGGTGANVGGTEAGGARSGGSAGRGGGLPDGGTYVDGGIDGSGLSPCSSPPSCGLTDLPVRVVISALGELQCGCVQNPCDGGFPTCDCAEPVCARYNATCTGYTPGSGYLVCTQPG